MGYILALNGPDNLVELALRKRYTELMIWEEEGDYRNQGRATRKKGGRDDFDESDRKDRRKGGRRKDRGNIDDVLAEKEHQEMQGEIDRIKPAPKPAEPLKMATARAVQDASVASARGFSQEQLQKVFPNPFNDGEVGAIPQVVEPETKSEVIPQETEPIKERTAEEIEKKWQQELESRPEEEEDRDSRRFAALAITRGAEEYSDLNIKYPVGRKKIPSEELDKEIDLDPEKMPSEELDKEISRREKAKFKLVASAAITELVVHGTFKKKDGKWVFNDRSDADGEAFVAICKMAGLGYETTVKENGKDKRVLRLTYVNPGEGAERAAPLDRSKIGGGIMVGDTSNRDIEVNLEQGIFYDDHHSPDSKPDSSAAKQAYELFVKVGLIEPNEEIRRAVDFITMMDNKRDPRLWETANFENVSNLVSLYRFLNFQEIRNFFSIPGRDPFKTLPDELITEWSKGRVPLKDRIDKEKENVAESYAQIDRLKRDGFVVETTRYGSVLVDIGGTVPKGADAAFTCGYDTYVRWNPEENGFVVISKKEENELDTDFMEQGFLVRKYMWQKPRNSEKIKFGLVDLLRKLGGDSFTSEGGLADYLKAEKEERNKHKPIIVRDVLEWMAKREAEKTVPETAPKTGWGWLYL